MGLIDIPDYLLADDIDLRYRRNPNLSKEIPFVDSFCIVRFLGGYKLDWLEKYKEVTPSLGEASLDYAVRDPGGALKYQPALIRDRLEPYLAAGYKPADITLGLDNVPWAVATPNVDGKGSGFWGQKNPPSSMELWRDVIRHFAIDLKKFVGPSVSAMSFETGIEYDERASFSASQDKFFNYYVSTYDGLTDVIPKAKLSPGEFTGIGECTTSKTCVYDSASLLGMARERAIPITTMPRSLYGTWTPQTGLPSHIVRRAVISYARLPDIVPEIHQFGLLGQPFSPSDGFEPAAAQASWQFQTLIGLWSTIRPRRVFHWGGFSPIGRSNFLNGPGFLRLVLDRYIGYEAILLPVNVSSGYEDPRTTEKMAVAFVSKDRVGVLVSSFSLDASTGQRRISFRLPSPLPSPKASQIKSARYRTSSCIFAAIRRDLANANNLQSVFLRNPDSVGEPLAMAKDIAAARMLIGSKWNHYVSIMKDGLRWRISPDISTNDHHVEMNIEANELSVLEYSPTQ